MSYTSDEMDELREYYLRELDKKDAENERLRAEIERLKIGALKGYEKDQAEIERLQTEIERLRSDNVRLRSQVE